MPFLAHFPSREEQQLTWARSPAHTHTHIPGLLPSTGPRAAPALSTAQPPAVMAPAPPPTDIPATVSSAQVLPRALGFIWDVGDVFNGLL